MEMALETGAIAGDRCREVGVHVNRHGRLQPAPDVPDDEQNAGHGETGANSDEGWAGEQRRRRYPFEVSPELLLRGLLADETSTVSLREAGADLERASMMITETQVRFIATSTWRVPIGGPS